MALLARLGLCMCVVMYTRVWDGGGATSMSSCPSLRMLMVIDGCKSQ